MEIVTTGAALRQKIRERGVLPSCIGLVPTMGYLHAGHEALLRRARAECDLVIASIFVNPTQFGPNEDLEKYPRDLAHDTELCNRTDTDFIFHPEARELYPRNACTWVTVDGLTEVACGTARPGHFRGVATVVTKLFNIIRPDRAYFGEKDYQQLQVIKRLIRDLFIPVSIIGIPTVREADGVALSSRNSYLTPTERQAARIVPRACHLALEMVENGEQNPSIVQAEIYRLVATQPMAKLDYAEIVDAEELTPVRMITQESRLLLAVQIGKTRLIDNIALLPKGVAPPVR